MDGQATACAACGASNPAQARWCGQCYTELEPSSSDGGEGPRGWTCRFCREANPLAASTCTTCGSPIFDSFGEPDEIVLPGEALRAALVPGMGLTRVGRPVEGTLTLVLVAFASLAGVFIVASGGAGGWVLIAVAVLLWLVASRDAYVMATGTDEPWLESRTISVAAGIIIIIAAILVLRTPLRGSP